MPDDRIEKECVSCGGKGHWYTECTVIPFFDLVRDAFGLSNRIRIMGKREQQPDDILDADEIG